MILWTTSQPWVENTGWFSDKVCVCKLSQIYHQGYDWRTMDHLQSPPTCEACGKWANMLGKCCKCEEHFYCFFDHPHMGHHMTPRRGWYCWNCLQRYLPPKVETGHKLPVTPPPAMVLPPGYVLVQGVGYR